MIGEYNDGAKIAEARNLPGGNGPGYAGGAEVAPGLFDHYSAAGLASDGIILPAFLPDS
ncbi:hypothetical protein D3C76_1685500 [compost metagenome]